MTKTYGPLLKLFAGPTSCKVKRIVGEGNVVAVEWHGETPLKNGGVYGNDYCWMIRVEGGKLKEVTGHFDTAAVDGLFGKGLP
jgi:uncharacterized protein